MGERLAGGGKVSGTKEIPYLLLLFPFDHNVCFGEECRDRADGGQLGGDQDPDHTKRHRDFQHRFALLILDDDPADTAFVDHFLDLADQLLAVDTKFFRTSFFFRHGILRIFHDNSQQCNCRENKQPFVQQLHCWTGPGKYYPTNNKSVGG